MPTPDFNGLVDNPNMKDIVDYIYGLERKLNYLLGNLDTKNVNRLDAKVIKTGTLDAGIVTVRSDLTGGAYVQIDSTGIIGNNGTINTFQIDTNGQAIFKSDLTGTSYIQIDGTGLKANNGTLNTLEINSSGNAYFRGDITSDATITGATFKTASTGARIELSSNIFRTYSALNNYNGMVFGSGIGTSYGDVEFYHEGDMLMEFYDGISGYIIRPVSVATSLLIGSSTIPTYIQNFYVLGAINTVGSISQSNSTAGDVPTIVSDFNTLLSNLRNMKILA